MRIACVDNLAADRVLLQKLFEDAYANCRDVVGHITLAKCYPASKEEALINKAPDIYAVGPGFNLEEAWTTCRDLKSTHPTVPIFIFIEEQHFSLRTLRRLEKVSDEIFRTDEDAIRIIHRLISVGSRSKTKAPGQLLTVLGVKGGVGATSVVSGLAHAVQALGKSAIVVDFSLRGCFAHYMAAERWQSADYAAVLVDRISPDSSLIERCVVTAPNEIPLLLAPAGGADIRELWLRDPSRLEINLSVIDILAELFDVILVDLAGAEGILPFALNCRADSRLLLTSNDPASVHLLATTLSEVTELPASGELRVLINAMKARSLNREDVLDFLYYNPNFEAGMLLEESLPSDQRAANWIGTGNSFYTECNRVVQKQLEQIASSLLFGEEGLRFATETGHKAFRGVRALSYKSTFQRKRSDLEKDEGVIKKRLPLLTPGDIPHSDVMQVAQDAELAAEKAKHFSPNGRATDAANDSTLDSSDTTATLYEPPKIKANT